MERTLTEILENIKTANLHTKINKIALEETGISFDENVLLTKAILATISLQKWVLPQIADQPKTLVELKLPPQFTALVEMMYTSSFCIGENIAEIEMNLINIILIEGIQKLHQEVRDKGLKTEKDCLNFIQNMFDKMKSFKETKDGQR